MRRVRPYAVAAALSLLVLVPSGAAALDGPCWPVAGPAVTLVEFGEAYVQDDSTLVHRGVDIAANPGDPTLSCAEGTVTFCGRIPTPSGSTVLAVTVLTSSGHKVTCSPLDAASVAKGQQVAVGDVLGSIAESGDASCDHPHVHVSVRDGERYVDPATILVAPAAMSAECPETDPTSQPAREPGAAAPITVDPVCAEPNESGGEHGSSAPQGVCSIPYELDVGTQPAATPESPVATPESPVATPVVPGRSEVAVETSHARSTSMPVLRAEAEHRARLVSRSTHASTSGTDAAHARPTGGRFDWKASPTTSIWTLASALAGTSALIAVRRRSRFELSHRRG